MKEQKFIRHKTIASIVTPLGEGGIGKIVVSGPDALSVVNKLFEGKGIADLRLAASQRLYYGHIHDGGQRIDEVILNIRRHGDSFTGEDVVEINCHGGICVVMRIYECLQSSGAEGVVWDSLILQSFENGKMDFIQKEALQEVVGARTKLGVKVLLDQYAGALSGALRQGLEIIEGIISDKDVAPVSNLTDHIRNLLRTASFGFALTTPQVLVILGKPNVGKSTLINAILGEERMLVHHEPGTTRDYVSEFVSIEGVPFEIVDTAGMRNTSDTLEAAGIEMTQEQLCRADKVIAVFDHSMPFDQEDETILNTLRLWLMAKNSDNLQHEAYTMIIPVVNKCDLSAKLDKLRIESVLQQPVCSLSARNKDGFEALNKRLVHFDTTYKPMKPVLFNKRQYLLLAKADTLIKHEKDCLAMKNKSGKILQLADELKGIFTMCLKGQ